MMALTPSMLKFCEQVAAGVSATRAYLAAHPNASYATAAANAYKVLRVPGVEDEILRLHRQAQQVVGPAVMSLIEKRSFLARVVRAQIARVPRESDLWNRVHTSKGETYSLLPDKLKAIRQDNQLSADDPMQQDSLTQLLSSIRR